MASSRTHRNLFIVVSLLSLTVFIFLTIDSLQHIQASSPPLTVSVVEGKKVWQRENCINCHTILGNGAYFAPDLTKEASKRSSDWLMKFLQNPDAVMPGTAMSSVQLDAADAENVVRFLEWVNEVDTNDWPPEAIMSSDSSSTRTGQEQEGSGADSGKGSGLDGKNIFLTAGCTNCHTVDDRGGNVGPDLSHIGGKRSDKYLRNIISSPGSVIPGSIMPAADLSEEKLDALVNYLVTLK
ncbi:c-type cytochrome [Metallumcola ferriviriculae]|uniref:C-type cytochrome n=1 Tax=Metallumcola ferriviriculae TaxID=3039180 RepID=A0AAU0UTF2_9FIRM|nr:c-type cytochrome [Desulfitibacteraceae bacterium MK1]